MKQPSRESYIFDRGDCRKCGEHKPVNIYGFCERCDKLAHPEKEYPIEKYKLQSNHDE